MGNSASKAQKVAARKYPTTTNIPQNITNKPSTRLPSNSSHGPQVHPNTSFSHSRDNTINSDASDPDFASMPHSQFNTRLRQLGPVQPNPTLSHTSYPPPTSQIPNSMFPSGSSPQPGRMNPTLLIMQSRARLTDEANKEFEDAARRGDAVKRRFLDVGMVRTMLGLSEEGKSADEVERRLGLEPGVVAMLGRGVFSAAQMPEPMAER